MAALAEHDRPSTGPAPGSAFLGENDREESLIDHLEEATRVLGVPNWTHRRRKRLQEYSEPDGDRL
jgi:hypothetical protein